MGPCLGRDVTYHQRNLKAAAELYLSWVFSIAVQPTVGMTKGPRGGGGGVTHSDPFNSCQNGFLNSLNAKTEVFEVAPPPRFGGVHFGYLFDIGPS